MAITNSERVGKALDLLKDGLQPYVERELKATYKDRWVDTARPSFPDWQKVGKDGKGLNWDTQALLQVMCELWNDCFKKILGPSDRNLAFELRDVRNKWAHQKAFSTDDAYRAIDSVSRLLAAVSAEQVEAVEQMKAEILRVKFDEQLRSQKRKESSIAVEGKPATGLRPWRDIVTPHPDVASGRYEQAEFAADLWQVYLGEGSDEYKDPIEFFVERSSRKACRSCCLTHCSGWRGMAATQWWNCRLISAAVRRTRCWRSGIYSPACPRDNCPGWRRSQKWRAFLSLQKFGVQY